ncbi:MAG TPA: aromatic-ring-hydroxylating dioxygenase subunit beta [Ramlibacter sp.]|uniref:aromatic-ring-hydroxylating dioxygenase subunit beta n=1 Tax=Ramlibacter sp. TaxID=1917967 RepID=UPI002CB1C405|nr:aromatic-ring-hydroxylating dioxygenase subunit beta [Ramlibacter sp.]HVZ45807.1 aromatic-ring-hydroxylating dioxygenase subunit beta [Ramlibacter sp.]
MHPTHTAIAAATVSRAEVEDFLFHEARLLDEWKLREWEALFAADGVYHVPTTGAPEAASPATTLFYVADDRLRITQRVTRLLKKGAHAEYPRSKTRHMITNVRIESREGDELVVQSSFFVHRSRDGSSQSYVGHYRHRLVVEDGRFMIREKRCTLDTDSLRPLGRISIVL